MKFDFWKYTGGWIGALIGYGFMLILVCGVRAIFGLPGMTESVALWTAIICLASCNIRTRNELRG